MTTRHEQHNRFDAAIDELISFQKAIDNIRRQLDAKGTDGMLRDIHVNLIEDGRSALLFSHYGNDALTCYASFALAETTIDAEFCSAHYIDMARELAFVRAA